MLPPARMAEIVRQKVEDTTEPIHVLWCRVDDESRELYAEELRRCRGALPLVPVIVRTAIFADPNTILSDLNQVLSASKDDILGLNLANRQAIVIVLLSRADFRLAQTGSLIRLPEWFPHIGGTEVYVRVRDLLFDLEVSRFNAPEARAEDLAAHLHRLETALVTRLERTLAGDPRHLDALWASIAQLRNTGPDRRALQERVATYRKHVDGVFDARAYRPSLKTKESFLSDLLLLLQKASPDGLIGLAKALVPAIGVPTEIEVRLSMPALLLRPTQAPEAPARFAHALLTSMYGGYQFLNAAAHASDYPSVSVAFLYLNSRDLRLALRHAAEQLDGMG